MIAFIVEARTGCSCCVGENHHRGPYKTREYAEKMVGTFKEMRLLASQFAPRGSYHIEEHEAEQLPDGRLIILDRVFPGFAEDGNSDRIDGL